jgi:hypothetical protein
MVKRALLYSSLRNQFPVELETMPEREFWTYLVSKDANPTNVTAVVKDRNNRARSSAAGVVSGAG